MNNERIKTIIRHLKGIIAELEKCLLKGIIPEITGRAFITAYNNLVLEDEDIFEHGIEF